MKTLPPTDLRTLYYFLRVCELRSFSEAARQEDVTPSVISRTVQQLEDQLGHQLLYRNTRSVAPTDAGLQFAQDAKHILEQFEQAQFRLNERRQQPSGIIRLNAPVVFGRRHIAAHLPALAQQYPQLQVVLNLNDEYIDPYAESADIIFRIGVLKDSTLHARKITTQEYYIAAAPQYLAQFGTPQTPEDLLQHRCLIYKNNSGTDRWLIRTEQGWRQYHVPATLTTNNAEAIYSACIQGLGLCLLPDWALYEGLQQGKLVRILPHLPTGIHTEPRTIAMLYPDMRHNSLNIRAVIDFFVEVFGAPVYWHLP